MLSGVFCEACQWSRFPIAKTGLVTSMGAEARYLVARELGETSLMFLVHPTLSPESLVYTGELVAEVMRAATR
jgi:hypothetical protein